MSYWKVAICLALCTVSFAGLYCMLNAIDPVTPIVGEKLSGLVQMAWLFTPVVILSRLPSGWAMSRKK